MDNEKIVITKEEVEGLLFMLSSIEYGCKHFKGLNLKKCFTIKKMLTQYINDFTQKNIDIKNLVEYKGFDII